MKTLLIALILLAPLSVSAKTQLAPVTPPAQTIPSTPEGDRATGVGCCYHAPFQLWEADEKPVYITCPGIGGICEDTFSSRWYKKVMHKLATELKAEGRLFAFPMFEKYL